MLFENIDLGILHTDEKMRLYHTMRSSWFFSSGTTVPKPECRFSIEKQAITSDHPYCNKCDVFGEYLVYAFYGRPAFKWKIEGTPNEPYPIFFVFHDNDTVKPSRIFPFDSGAFHCKRYGSAYSSSVLEDYALALPTRGVSPEKIPALVQAIWGSAQAYYHGNIPKGSKKLTDSTSVPLSAFDREYLSFIYSGFYNEADSRAFTIEYSYNDSLPLDSLERVYLPSSINLDIVEDLYNKLTAACGHDILIMNIPCLDGVDPFLNVYNIEGRRLFSWR